MIKKVFQEDNKLDYN